MYNLYQLLMTINNKEDNNLIKCSIKLDFIQLKAGKVAYHLENKTNY